MGLLCASPCAETINFSCILRCCGTPAVVVRVQPRCDGAGRLDGASSDLILNICFLGCRLSSLVSCAMEFGLPVLKRRCNATSRMPQSPPSRKSWAVNAMCDFGVSGGNSEIISLVPSWSPPRASGVCADIALRSSHLQSAGHTPWAHSVPLHIVCRAT
jgi:hypothetical protein